MFIKQLDIHGYRSFRQASWRPGALNLVVGPNGGGKSNLLHLLALISKAADGKLAKSISEAGGMVRLLWDHQPGSIKWELRFDACDEENAGRRISYEVTLDQLGRGSAYKISRDAIVFWNEREKKPSKSITSGSRRTVDAQIAGYDPNESVAKDYESAGLDRLRLLTIHRDIDVGANSSIRRPTTTQHVEKLDDDGANLVPVLHTLYTGNREFKGAIDEGMRAGFGEEFDRLEFQPAAAQQIQLAIQWKSSAEPHAGQDLSDGTLRFLFLLTALAHPSPPPLVAIEEPDAGLHPSMLSIIAEFAEAASQRTQVVLTSHSPAFLDTFTAMSPAVTLCHWADGQTHLYTLDAVRLKAWLERYRLGHLFTSGELEALALPDVEPVAQDRDPFADLPGEDEALAKSVGDSGDGGHG